MLDLRDFLLPAFPIHDPRLEIDHDSVQVFDLADHFVGGSTKSPKPALLPQRAMAAAFELRLRELLCFPHRIVSGRARNGAVVDKSISRIVFVDEPQFPDVFDPIEDESQDRSIRVAID